MRIKDMIEIAALFTKRGNTKRDYYLAAIGERKDGVIVLARNETDKIRNPLIHAEARLIGKLDACAPLVIVVRISKGTGAFAMAKPCVDCERALSRRKVKKVLYTTGSGLSSLW